MRNETLSVPEIHCDHCKSSIEEAIGALDGVSAVSVRIEPALVDVTFDQPADMAAIVNTIEAVGYEVAGSPQ